MIQETGNMNLITSGTIVAGYRDANTMEFTPFLSQKNLVTYGGADIMAKIINGDCRYAINGMYFGYDNGTPDAYESRKESVRSVTAMNFESSMSTGSKNFLRVPIITTGKIDKSPVDSQEYNGNSVTFVASTASMGTVEVGGIHVAQGVRSGGNDFASNVSISKIIRVALVAMPNQLTEHRNNDIIFSVSSLEVPIPAIENSFIDIFWTLKFT